MYYNRILRFFGTLLAAVMLFFGLLPPVFFGIFHTGVFVTLALGGTLLACCLFWEASPGWWRGLRRWVAAALAAALGLGAVASALMAGAAWFTPPREPATVIVLGCQVVEDRPSLMLLYRLQAAKAWLDGHPDAPVVCSGGFKGGGAYSEAAVMRKWLLEQGIAPERVYVEERSRNTDENVRFSAEIIRREGLPESLAVATDSFHQLRGAVYARRNGLQAGALPAKSPWGLLPTYWVREWFGLVKAVLF